MEGGVFPLPGGRAHFAFTEAPDATAARGHFRLSTRRGKQFNSIVQSDFDSLTGASRDHVFMCPDDMSRLDLGQDDAVRVMSEHGTFLGRAFAAPIACGNAQMHWPEANVLIPLGRVDPVSRVPDYNAWVRIEPVDPRIPVGEEIPVAAPAIGAGA
jgi:anaerobic selenocysteine-containing dehydrogenase